MTLWPTASARRGRVRPHQKGRGAGRAAAGAGRTLLVELLSDQVVVEPKGGSARRATRGTQGRRLPEGGGCGYGLVSEPGRVAGGWARGWRRCCPAAAPTLQPHAPTPRSNHTVQTLPSQHSPPAAEPKPGVVGLAGHDAVRRLPDPTLAPPRCAASLLLCHRHCGPDGTQKINIQYFRLPVSGDPYGKHGLKWGPRCRLARRPWR
jgi:hypothetical protein